MSKRKGIILAGGSGTRLFPLTKSVSKQLLPVYDKPLIYYPLSVLMMAGIREILIITTPEDRENFQRLLGTGEEWGISLHYTVQEKPVGLAHAFHLADRFINRSPSCLILGDNIFYGNDLVHLLQRADKREEGATLFAHYVKEPEHYGVVAFDEFGKATSLEEKPTKPKSNFAVTGLYFYDEQVVDFSHSIKPSRRGELEITDVNRLYMEQGKVHVELLRRGFAWLDAGTHHSLLEASNFISVIENRQSLKICCPEEIAWRMGYISNNQLENLASPLCKSGYGVYLLNLLERAKSDELPRP